MFHAAELITDVFCQMRERITLAQPAFGSDIFVAAGKGDWLEGHEGDLLRVFHRELHDGANLIIIHVIDDSDDENDLDARRVHVFDGTQLHIKQIAYLSMAVRVISDTIELQVGVAQASFERLLAKVLALGEFDSIGGRLHAVVSELPRIADGVKEIRM